MKNLLFAVSTAVIMTSCAVKPTNNYSKIQYEAGACFGTCPIFKITINPDKSALIEAEHFTFKKGGGKGEFSAPREGNFTAKITDSEYQKLLKLLEEINPKSLQNNYGNHNVTDLPTATLHIKFSDRTEKTISDYGKNGTEKLAELYKFFEDLRFNQTWTKVGE